MIARGWLGLFVLSVRLGLGYTVRRRAYLREAVVRAVVPMDPSRYLEFPETLRELAARPGERVIDLASPKLVAVHLARQGVEVVSVDELESEIATWNELAGDTGLTVAVAPALVERGRRRARLSPMAVNRGYERSFPFLVPLGWAFPLLVHEVDGPGGDMLRVTYVKRGA